MNVQSQFSIVETRGTGLQRCGQMSHPSPYTPQRDVFMCMCTVHQEGGTGLNNLTPTVRGPGGCFAVAVFYWHGLGPLVLLEGNQYKVCSSPLFQGDSTSIYMYCFLQLFSSVIIRIQSGI